MINYSNNKKINMEDKKTESYENQNVFLPKINSSRNLKMNDFPSVSFTTKYNYYKH